MTTYETIRWTDGSPFGPMLSQSSSVTDAADTGDAIPFGLDDGGDEPAPAGAAAAFTTDAEAR